jgi:hypothetical protein
MTFGAGSPVSKGLQAESNYRHWHWTNGSCFCFSGLSFPKGILPLLLPLPFWLSFRAQRANLLSPVLRSYHPEAYKPELQPHLRRNVVFAASTAKAEDNRVPPSLEGRNDNQKAGTKTICAP